MKGRYQRLIFFFVRSILIRYDVYCVNVNFYYFVLYFFFFLLYIAQVVTTLPRDFAREIRRYGC